MRPMTATACPRPRNGFPRAGFTWTSRAFLTIIGAWFTRAGLRGAGRRRCAKRRGTMALKRTKIEVNNAVFSLVYHVAQEEGY